MDSVQLNTQRNAQDTYGMEKRGISGSTIKLIAIIAMVIDHVAAVILVRQMMLTGYSGAVLNGTLESAMEWQQNNMGIYIAYLIMRLIGRLAFPIFCFLLIEGFRRTSDVKKYLVRIGMFALISEIPFDMALSGAVFAFGNQNVFFTLFLGLAALCAYEYFAKKELHPVLGKVLTFMGVAFTALYITLTIGNTFGVADLNDLAAVFMVVCIITAIVIALYGKNKGMHQVQVLCGNLTALMLCMILADLLYTDYSSMGVLTITIMYLFRKNKVRSVVAGCIVLAFVDFFNEITAFLAAIPVKYYNGERGLKMKYSFYAFYPVHLLVLYLIAVLIGVAGAPFLLY